MRVVATSLPEVLLLEPVVRGDERGYFSEVWNEPRYTALGITGPFVQDNLSYSKAGVLRGLHLQWPTAQGKLVWAPHGAVFDVAVDVRVGSPTFGAWTAVELSASNGRQLWIPPGFAHGFAAQDAEAVLHYKVTAAYEPTAEITIAWNDPALGITWPLSTPRLSARDSVAPSLADVVSRLPRWSATSGLLNDPQ